MLFRSSSNLSCWDSGQVSTSSDRLATDQVSHHPIISLPRYDQVSKSSNRTTSVTDQENTQSRDSSTPDPTLSKKTTHAHRKLARRPNSLKILTFLQNSTRAQFISFSFFQSIHYRATESILFLHLSLLSGFSLFKGRYIRTHPHNSVLM